MTFTPTDEQLAIRDALLNTTDNLAIDAGPGCGKSSTLVWLTESLDRTKTGQMTCFGADIHRELNDKLKDHPKFSASTFNSLAWNAMRKELARRKGRQISFKEMGTNEAKYRQYARDLTQDEQWIPKPVRMDVAKMLEKTGYFAMVTLADYRSPEALNRIIESYGLLPNEVLNGDYGPELPDKVVNWVIFYVPEMMHWGATEIDNFNMTFTDQVYYTVKWNLRVYATYYLFIDEAQDISALELALLKKAVYRNGRVVVVGDPAQMIYSFKGTMPNSFKLVTDEFNCTPMSLTKTFRCASKIVELANRVKPKLQPFFPDRVGSIRHIDMAAAADELTPGDAVIARLNSPLVGLCIDLIKRNVPATILGRDIGASLTKRLDEVAERKNYSFDTLADSLTAYQVDKVAALVNRDADEREIEMFNDMCLALEAVIERFTDPEMRNAATTLDQLKDRISALFSEPKDTAGSSLVTLMTAHKSKGLEFDRVFLVSHKMPLSITDAEEWRIWFVAVTRAKNELVTIGKAKPDWIEGFLDAPQPALPDAAATDTGDDAADAPDNAVETKEIDIADLYEPSESYRAETKAADTDDVSKPVEEVEPEHDKPLKLPKQPVTGNLKTDITASQKHAKLDDLVKVLSTLDTAQLDAMIALMQEIRDAR